MNDLYNDLLKQNYIRFTKCDSDKEREAKNFLIEQNLFENSFDYKGLKCFQITNKGLEARRLGYEIYIREFEKINHHMMYNINIHGNQNELNITNNNEKPKTDKMSFWANFLSVISSLLSFFRI